MIYSVVLISAIQQVTQFYIYLSSIYIGVYIYIYIYIYIEREREREREIHSFLTYSFPLWFIIWSYLVTQTVNNLPAIQETQVQLLG